MHPRRLDGKALRVLHMPDGRIFVDTLRVTDEQGELIHRSGPEHPQHHCRFEDYGLTEGMERCRKCGLVR